MTLVVFSDKTKEPNEIELAEALGSANDLWCELKRSIAARFDGLVEEWAFGGKNYGWSLRLKQKKRAVLYMTPLEHCFRVSLAFGEKAVQAAHQSDLPESILNVIDAAPIYPEGRAVRMEIRGAEELDVASKLAGIKMAN